MTQLHRPQVRATSARCHRTVCHSWNIPFLFLCFFFFFTSSYFAALSTSPSLVWCQNSDLCFMSDDPFCGGVEMVTMVWSRMMNNRSKVLDRDLLVYDHTSWQKIQYMACPRRSQPDLAALQRPQLYRLPLWCVWTIIQYLLPWMWPCERTLQ